MIKKLHVSFLFICFVSLTLRAGGSWTIKPFQRKAFIENNGQFKAGLPQQYRNFNYCIDNNARVLFTKQGLTHVVRKVNRKKLGFMAVFMSEEKREEMEHQTDLEVQYINMKWLNANPDVEMVISEAQVTSYNYLMRPTNEKAYVEMCKGYSKLTYKNLYSGIDVEYFFTEKDGFKYNLIVSAGADISQVQMQYSGDAKLSIKEGNIIIKSLRGDIIDHAPISYLAANSSNHITSSFSLKNNIVSFAVNNPDKQAIVIDPWTIAPGMGGNPAYDNGVDGAGNVYLYGGNNAAGNVAEKYPSSGTPLLWSLTNGATGNWAGVGYYYGDLLVQATGDFYLSDGATNVAAGASTFKFNANSVLTWQSTSSNLYQEHWRLGINCITNEVIAAGGGTTSPTNNIAQINVATGVLSNVLSFGPHDDMSGLCIDILGKSYVHGANSNTIYFTNTTNTPVGNVPSGYTFSELGIVPSAEPSYYTDDAFGENIGNGYNMMALGGTTFLFTSDGATLKKWDRNTYALLASAAIPGGSPHKAGGILADVCGNVFVGSTTGVYRYDFNLNVQEFHPTSAATYDIAFSSISSDIVACGLGFAADIPFGRITCGSLQVILTVNPCNPSINTVAVHPVVSNNSIPPYSFLWNDGNTDSVRTNLSPGQHIVVVRDGECIPQFTSDTINIAAGSPMTIVKKPACFGSNNGSLEVNVSAGQQILSYTVAPAGTNSLVNDSTILATSLAAGNYTFTIQSSSGCTFDSVIALSQVTAITATTQSLVAAICPGQSTGSGEIIASGGVPFTAAGHTPYTYSWNTVPVQTTSVITNVMGGTYTVTITDSLGCQATNTVTIPTNPSPHAAFIGSTACQGTATTYTDQSTPTPPSVSPIISWSWSFTNNGIINSTIQNPSNTFSVSGTYTTSLIITDANGCKDTALLPVNMYPTPVVNFSSTPVCFNSATNFTNTSTIAAPDNITTWNWAFGEGTSSSTSQNPSYTYTTTTNYTLNSTYTVQLTATSNHGCKDSLTQNTLVYSLPSPAFTSDSVCLGNPSHLVDASNGNGNTLTNYVWNAAGTLLNGTPTSYVFPSAGNNVVNYTVTTTLITGLSCTNFTTENVWVNPLPQAVFSFTNVCVNAQPTSFNASASNISIGTISSYSWGYGDAQTGTGVTTTHAYANAQSYVVTLTVTSTKGCTDTVSHVITAYPTPKASISIEKGVCLGSTTSFTANTLAGSGNIVKWYWYVSNPPTNMATMGQISSYQYGAAGSQTLALITMTDNNCYDTIYQVTYVNYLPQAIFTTISPDGCSPHCVGFNSSTSTVTAPAQLTTFVWSFGDGSSISNISSTTLYHCFQNNSNTTTVYFNVQLVLSTDSACKDSITTNMAVAIYPNPLAGFGWGPKTANIIDATVYFTSDAIGASGPNAYNWNFGDTYGTIDSLNYSTTTNPIHVYANPNPADYTVTQIVSNIYGCKDSITEVITILDAFTFYIPNSFTPNGDGINDGFKGLGIGINTSTYNMWIFDRWGLMIYYTNDINQVWDGHMMGHEEQPVLQEDVYVWKVSFTDVFNKPHQYHGTVTLVR
jgi:gliding motility-associated-like protein